jgi:hypothetical protein
VKFCKDCRWFVPVPETAGEPLCGKPGSAFQDPVFGRHKPPLAKNERKVSGLCGPQGKYWEKREEAE